MEGPAAHEQYVRDFMALQFPAGDVPVWAVEALATADIHISTTLSSAPSTAPVGVGASIAEAAPAVINDGAEVTSSKVEGTSDGPEAKKTKI